jgi:probable FeS assembly SUF system protein SufT
MIPSGESVSLSAGTKVWLTQSLGGSYTVMTDQGYTVRIDGRCGDLLGLPKVEVSAALSSGSSIEDQVWAQLRSCFDPEIPVNIVELGLVYDCQVSSLPTGGYKAVVHFTLTAQGCGMGEFIKADIKKKLLSLPQIREADVELIWDPPWNQSRMSVNAKHQLGIE